jgi:lipopolysaccharide transport system permease protein
MSVALHTVARNHISLELRPPRTWAERHRLARRDLIEAAQHWRLCWMLAWLDIRLRYRGSMLGPFWLTLSTAVMAASMGVLYAALFHLDVHVYLPFLTLSLVLWNFLGVLSADACVAYTQADSTIRSVRMPYSLYGGRVVLRNLLVLAHNAVVVLAVDLLLHAMPGWQAVYALPALALWLVDALALALLLGALCARFRDIPPIVASIMQMAFFVSAVIWKPEQLGAREWLLAFNPFFTLLEIVRAPLLGTAPSTAVIASALGYSALLIATSWMLFARVRGRIAFWV